MDLGAQSELRIALLRHAWLYPLCEPSILCDGYHDLVGKGGASDISLYAIYGSSCLLGDGWVGRRNAGWLGQVCCHWERHVNNSKVSSLMASLAMVDTLA